MKKLNFYLVRVNDKQDPPKIIGFSINKGSHAGITVDSTSIHRGLGKHDDLLVTKTLVDAKRWSIPVGIVHSEQDAIRLAHKTAVELAKKEHVKVAEAEGFVVELIDLTDLKS